MISRSVLLAVAVALTSCGAGTHPPKVSARTPDIEGFAFTLPFPRPDIHPGTALLRFDNGDVEPFCQPGVDFGGAGSDQAPTPIKISEDKRDELKATLKASAEDIANATLGGSASSKASVAMALTPVVTKNVAVDAQQIMGMKACQDNLATLRAGNRKITYASLVKDVAEIDVEYTIEIASGVQVSAEAAKGLAEKLHASATVGIETGSSTKLHVTGTKLIGNYNADEHVLGPMTSGH